MTSTQFTDDFGLVWDIKLNLNAANRIEKSDFSELGGEAKVSFLKADRRVLSMVMGNDSLMAAVIWAIVQPQAQKYFEDKKFPFDPSTQQDKAQEQFCDGFTGPVLFASREAMWEALQNFFHDQATVLSQLRQQMKIARTKIDKKFEELIPEVQAELDSRIENSVSDLRKEIAQVGKNS